MSKTRNLSDLLDANGDVKSTALDNVPASNDASALTTGTLPNARLSAVPNSALANSSITINGSATSLGGSATINTDLVNDTTPQLGGTLDTNGNPINFGDNDKAQFGASQDLEIYHDGSNSYINETGTGNLLIRASSAIRMQRHDGTENFLTTNQDGACELYYNGSKKLETTSTGATVTGTLTATAFSGDGSALTNLSAGKVGQVVQTVKGNVSSTSSGTYSQISGLTASITPSSSSSKILVKIAMQIGQSNSTTATFKAYRGSTIIGIGDSDGSRQRVSTRVSPDNQHWMFPVYYEYLDSPSTSSAVTYSMYWSSGDFTYINRTHSNGNDTSRDQAKPISTITLMEILP